MGPGGEREPHTGRAVVASERPDTHAKDAQTWVFRLVTRDFEGPGFMPTCAEASPLPYPTDPVVPMQPLPPGEVGKAELRFIEIGKSSFRPGQSPAMNKVISYSEQKAWPEGTNKPESENLTVAQVERFYRRLLVPQGQGGYGLRDLGSILATPEPTAPAASGATLLSTSYLSQPHFKGFLDHMVKVARQLAHQGSGVLRAHATAAYHALSSEPVQPLGMVRLYQAARLAAGGQGTDTQDPAILGQMGEFLEVCRLRKELGEEATIEWLNVDVEMGKPYDILVRYPLRGPDGLLTGSYEEVEVDVKVAGIKAHFDPARPESKKPNTTREFKIELRIPEDTLRLWRAPPGTTGARRRVLRVIVPAMSARA